VDSALLYTSLLHPPVLFFFAGLLAAWLKSDLAVPEALSKFLSLYLLLAIGFRGGVELAHGGLTPYIGKTLLVSVAIAIVIPLVVYRLLRGRLGSTNAAAVAATYGSVSAVTFVAATSLLDAAAIPYGGHMVAALALMESPAIVAAVALYRSAQANGSTGPQRLRSLVGESLLNGSVFLLLASVAIGMLATESGVAAMQPFTGDLFTGILCLFLLDMGLMSARRLRDVGALDRAVVSFALVAPLVLAGIATGVAWLAGLAAGDAFLLCVLCASASYIAVPAALKHAIPEANPGIYLTMALALTFPLNLIAGLPIYLGVIRTLWPG
jgi:uncharacterized protein